VKLYIYNENCVMAGHSVRTRELERYENPDAGGDWTVHEGTENELIEYARNEIKYARTAGAGSDRYRRRVARTIMEAIGWSKEKIDHELDSNAPRFTREQIAFVADKILAAALDRIESCLPDTIPLTEFQEHHESIDHAMSMAMDTAAMALAILFAQTTGEGMGVWDWAGSTEFRDTCARFIMERTAPNWPGLKAGEPCYPDTKQFAELFADEWEETAR